MWHELRFSKAFQRMLTSFAETEATDLFNFLDLKFTSSGSNQEFNMLSKIIQEALHVDEYGYASICGHACRLRAYANSALALLPDVSPRTAISFLLHLQETRSPLSSQPLQRQPAPHGSSTPGQWGTIRSSYHPHWNSCNFCSALTGNESSQAHRGVTDQVYHAPLQKAKWRRRKKQTKQVRFASKLQLYPPSIMYVAITSYRCWRGFIFCYRNVSGY